MVDENEIIPTQDELNAEAEALEDAAEEEIRTKIVTELGISEDDNRELVDKLVQRELDSRGKLAKAIGQKIKYRDQLNGGKKPAVKTPAKNLTPDEIAEQARKAAVDEYEKRDLDLMPHSDKVKDQIKRVAQLQNITVRQAEQDPYIKSLIDDEVRQKSVNDAAKGGKPRTKSGVVVDTSKPLDPADYDLSTEEGRNAWKEAKKAYHEARK